MAAFLLCALIFPTGVGVNRFIIYVSNGHCHIPHRRGGEPGAGGNLLGTYLHIPHRRGGEPGARLAQGALAVYSPQAWG